jgi:hypothetical protein
MSNAIFNRDGTLSRRHKTPCRQCGPMEACDECWDHERDWSPFYIWHCLLCRMPQAGYDDAGNPHRCNFCGWDEATEWRSMVFETDDRGVLICYEIKYDEFTREPISWHCLPEFAQGRKAIWTAVNSHTGKRRIDEAFPHEFRENTSDNEMFIRFRNGSTWQVIGSDRYDATVGAGVAGITYSEYALSNPSAWAYHRPMLQENDGWAIFITTPRGHNHAKSMFDHRSRQRF